MEPKNIAVELHTGHGPVFIGDSSYVEVRTDEGAVLMIPAGETFMSMVHLSTITLRCGGDLKTFNLKNTTAGLHGRHLTVLAEEILEVALPSPQSPYFEACSSDEPKIQAEKTIKKNGGRE